MSIFFAIIAAISFVFAGAYLSYAIGVRNPEQLRFEAHRYAGVYLIAGGVFALVAIMFATWS